MWETVDILALLDIQDVHEIDGREDVDCEDVDNLVENKFDFLQRLFFGVEEVHGEKGVERLFKTEAG